MSVNEHTGARLVTKPPSDTYRENYDKIFKGLKTMKYKTPVDFVVAADSPEQAKLQLNEFLLRAVSEYRLLYNIADYEIPYGYAVEEVSGT